MLELLKRGTPRLDAAWPSTGEGRMQSIGKRLAIGIVLALATVGSPRAASAFCGFYVSGADTKLFNNATQVVLMREGQRTVLSMQNNYQGPPENFAMVVPVPVVLQKENVKTLPRDIFDRVDQLTSPRLVEYWEQDPCGAERMRFHGAPMGAVALAQPAAASASAASDYGVKIEAKFAVGEYEILVLSAKDSGGLDAWLRDNKYKIPAGAEPYLRPYVQEGSKFFVAKVDASKVKFERIGSGPETAALSPLRFHYDSERFNLPIRLGLINSNGTQDLIVNILARGQRYETANYPNVTIPTNLDVAEGAKDKFGTFYTALYDRTLEQHPKAVVTEYSWDTASCDPCPTPPLAPEELTLLGDDVLNQTPMMPTPAQPTPPQGGAPSRKVTAPPTAPPMMPPPRAWGGGFVITRMHARYARDALGEDLVFRAAPPIQGGREWPSSAGGIEKGAQPSPMNNFQARYAIRHLWEGPIKCEHPVRGRWGGPPGNPAWGGNKAQSATKIAFAPRGGVSLPALLREDLPDLGVKADAPMPLFTTPAAAATVPAIATDTPTPIDEPRPAAKSSDCGCSVVEGRGGTLSAFALSGLALVFAARRTARPRQRRGVVETRRRQP
jgi:hypothetical protein